MAPHVRAHEATAIPASTEAVRALIRAGLDTIDIARLYGSTEAAVWNALVQRPELIRRTA